MPESETPQIERGGYIRDARGRPVTLLDPYELNVLRRYDVIPADTLRLIADAVGFGLPKWQRRGYIACVVMFLACVAFLVFWKIIRGAGVDAVERVLWPVNLTVFVFGAIQFWRSGRRARAKLVRAVMLKHLRCPHCGYDIRGLPTDSTDGATICPECGCAWTLDSTQTLGDHSDG
ncbi:MAG: hypothetical protein JSV19_00500 [Phycisphaerales bacterium]|nr:MAG: hypothetical protein JSV19_00500 [Phycisphaerales bacterium]